MQAPRHRLYKDAEALFVEQGLTCSAIAEQLKITEATLSKWRKQMNWDDLRAAVLTSPAKIRQILTAELQHIAEGGKPRVDSDALAKVAKSLSYFDGRVSLSVVVSVFKEFDNWIAGVDPARAVEISEVHRLFVNYRAEIDSNK